jgi:ribulose kinase
MAIMAGVDFGTLSVRVSLVDSERGLLASAIAKCSLHRRSRRSGIRDASQGSAITR